MEEEGRGRPGGRAEGGKGRAGAREATGKRRPDGGRSREDGRRGGGTFAGREPLRRALLRVGNEDFATGSLPILRVSEVGSSETGAAQFARARGSRGIGLSFPINDSRHIQTVELEAQF
jgi:hypothetical protein